MTQEALAARLSARRQWGRSRRPRLRPRAAGATESQKHVAGLFGSARITAWKRFSKRLWRELGNDYVANGAAAMAFYMVLALFPAAIFALSLLPHLPIPRLQLALTDLVRQALPNGAAELLMKSVLDTSRRGGTGLLSFGFLFAVWSASSGIGGIIQQLNVVYNVKEDRSFLHVRGLSLLLTFSFFFLIMGALGLAVFGGMLQSAIGDHWGWSTALLAAFAALRWAVIVVALQFAITLVYYFGPNQKHSFLFFTPGSLTATALLLLASVSFKIYVARFARFDVLYGGLGAVIVLLLWLFLAGWVILFGAEVNDVLRQNGTTPNRSP